MQKRQSARELRLISQSSAPTEECSSRHHFNMDRWGIIFRFIHFSLHQSFFIHQDWSENFSFPYPEHLNISEKYFKNAPELFAIRICEGSQLTPRTSLKTREELNAFQRNRKRHQRKWSRILLVSTDTIVQSRIMIRSQKILTSSRRNLLAEIHQPFENHSTSFSTCPHQNDCWEQNHVSQSENPPRRNLLAAQRFENPQKTFKNHLLLDRELDLKLN